VKACRLFKTKLFSLQLATSISVVVSKTGHAIRILCFALIKVNMTIAFKFLCQFPFLF
jgi:hypothetical protein